MFIIAGKQIWASIAKTGVLSWVSGLILLLGTVLVILRMANAWEIFTLHNNDDNVRYFLSAAAQAIAGLFALVITVSLIVMQLLTQTYTSAIFEIYVKRFRVLVSFIVSGFTIVFSLYVLLQIQDNLVCQRECTETDIILVLVAFSVIWNVVYFFDLLQIVKPKNFLRIIDKKLLGSRGKKEYLSLVGEICIISMNKGDLATANDCLEIFRSILSGLTKKNRAHLNEILENIFKKAIEINSAEMIGAVVGISFYQQMSPLWTT